VKLRLRIGGFSRHRVQEPFETWQHFSEAREALESRCVRCGESTRWHAAVLRAGDHRPRPPCQHTTRPPLTPDVRTCVNTCVV
jgi:hypothetical protein